MFTSFLGALLCCGHIFLAAGALTAPERIAGRRCLWQRAATDDANGKKNKKNAEHPPPSPPPLVVCVGMAQTVHNWEHHLAQLGDGGRDVLLYEAAGLGQEESTEDLSLPAQAAYLLDTIHVAFGGSNVEEDGPIAVDLAGFSLGGRIALATALKLQLQKDETHDTTTTSTANRILQIRKLHLTGVSLDRSDEGRLHLFAWKDHLQHDNLRAFAWSALLVSYSTPFLMQNKNRLPQWIDSVCQSHTASGLLQLMEQAHDDTDDGEWSVASMAQKLPRHTSFDARLLVGQDDRMAPMDRVRSLAEQLQWPATTVPGVGHSVPLEEPRAWRDDLLEFLRQ